MLSRKLALLAACTFALSSMAQAPGSAAIKTKGDPKVAECRSLGTKSREDVAALLSKAKADGKVAATAQADVQRFESALASQKTALGNEAMTLAECEGLSKQISITRTEIDKKFGLGATDGKKIAPASAKSSGPNADPKVDDCNKANHGMIREIHALYGKPIADKKSEVEATMRLKKFDDALQKRRAANDGRDTSLEGCQQFAKELADEKAHAVRLVK